MSLKYSEFMKQWIKVLQIYGIGQKTKNVQLVLVSICFEMLAVLSKCLGQLFTWESIDGEVLRTSMAETKGSDKQCRKDTDELAGWDNPKSLRNWINP